MKIIQINASYKPAFIYGGPTMSVSKLAEELVKSRELGVESGQQSEVKSLKPGVESSKSKVQGSRLANPLIERKVEVEVLTTTANGDRELNVPIKQAVEIDGVKVTYFRRLTKDHTHFSPSLLWSLTKLIQFEKRAKNKDQRTKNNELIIHIHAWWNLVSMLSCAVAYWYKIPVLLSPRGMLTAYTLGNRNAKLKSTLHWLLGRKLLAYCHIHATSLKEKEDIHANFRVRSVSVVPNFVRLGEVRANAATSSRFRMLFLSRVEQKKGLELLFEALVHLDFSWELTIAGTGEAEYIESLQSATNRLGIANKINWLGQVSNEDKFELLAQHQLLVLTSYNENFANVVIESLSVGTPVLISTAVGLADYVIANEFGWVCNLEVKDIAIKINTAHAALAQRQKIATYAPNQIKVDFNEQKLVAQYLKLYQNLS